MVSGHLIEALTSHVQKRWIEFFQDPAQWWDNRSKIWSRASHFTHVTTGEVLSISSCPQCLQPKLKSLELPPRSSTKGFKARFKGARLHEPQKPFLCFVAALKQCSSSRDLEGGTKIHADAVEAGTHTDKYVAAELITMYSKCRFMASARAVFDGTARKDAVTWNCLVMGYVENAEFLTALETFRAMDVRPTRVSYLAALKACAGLACERKSGDVLLEGMRIHEELRQCGYDSDPAVANTLVDMYSKCREVGLALEVFDGMACKDVVSWTNLMMGYMENGMSSIALDLFANMDCEPTDVTYVAALKSCAALAVERGSDRNSCLKKGMAIHEKAKMCGFDSQTFVANTLIDLYSKCRCMALAKEVFDKMPRKDTVSWNCLVAGYVDNGESLIALNLFVSMGGEGTLVTYLALLKACGNEAWLAVGRWLHAKGCSRGFEQDEMVATALIDFYGKCGCMANAEVVFDGLQSPDIESWTALIAGFSSVGSSSRVLSVANQIRETGLRMDILTFSCILTACSHTGMVEEGKTYFESMMERGVVPTLKHYTCMVDLLGRVNRLEEALAVVRSMPHKADSVTWLTLLGACKKWRNLEVGKVAFDELVKGDARDDAAPYVLMSDLLLDCRL